MSRIDTFCAVHSSGLLVPTKNSVTAMALLFDKVYLPGNVETIRAFAQRFRIRTDAEEIPEIRLEASDGSSSDPFEGLTETQRETVNHYLDWSMRFAFAYGQLFGDVFQTNAFDGGSPIKVELLKEGGPGELNTYRCTRQALQITEGDDELYPKLIEDGYVPIVTHAVGMNKKSPRLDPSTTKSLAALLAMKSVEMLFPRTRAADPEVILEARDRLKDHLPPFWAAMFKLSGDLRKLYQQSDDPSQIQIEAENMVDSTVRPALIDLRQKLEHERKQFFYRILSPIQKGLRLMIGNPPITQEQLVTNALLLASDANSAGADHLKAIEVLKNSSGLTYLLELDKLSIQKDEQIAGGNE